MGRKFTEEELNNLNPQALVMLILSMQNQMELMNRNLENLTEQIRLANSQRFGRHSEKLSDIEGQLSIFDEAETLCEPGRGEPVIGEVLPQKQRGRRPKGKREADLSDFPTEQIYHPVTDEEADRFYGKSCWRRMPDETYKKLRYTPASWTVEIHTLNVVVGKSGLHQDEFLRGKHPHGLLKNSILTPSLGAAILNGKFTNAMPYDRIEKEFRNFDVSISKPMSFS